MLSKEPLIICAAKANPFFYDTAYNENFFKD